MNKNSKQLLMAAAVAGMIGASPLIHSTALAENQPKKGTCTEKNSCNGKGNCAGKANGKEHACKGQNDCSNNQIKDKTKRECNKLEGTWKQS